MNNFVIDTPDNFWQIRWLDKYMEGHKGFIAGGCFKNILSGEKVKDIDIFFESESDFQEAVDLFNDTVKKANEIKDRVLKYVYNIKQERSYNNDLVGIFERYKDIADGDMEVAMNFIKEAYPFNEETESFIRKKFDMPIPDESKEQ